MHRSLDFEPNGTFVPWIIIPLLFYRVFQIKQKTSEAEGKSTFEIHETLGILYFYWKHMGYSEVRY